jgi:hypothetical protein
LDFSISALVQPWLWSIKLIKTLRRSWLSMSISIRILVYTYTHQYITIRIFYLQGIGKIDNFSSEYNPRTVKAHWRKRTDLRWPHKSVNRYESKEYWIHKPIELRTQWVKK